MRAYEKLLEPIAVGTHQWRNRMVKAPSSAMSWDPGQFCNDTIIGLYDTMAQGGTSAIILGGMICDDPATLIDDADGGVTEIVRGRDLLSSTPRQLWLQETLGFAHPAYYHVPLLTAPDGRRLSKREKDLNLGALRQRLSPQELLGQLAYLAGLQPEPAPATAAELASRFSWDLVVSDNIVIHSEFT